MHRKELDSLYKWKESKHRKPLLIEGARQVGKTWLMKEFGEMAYKNTIYISFDSNEQMRMLFSSDADTNRIIAGLEVYSGKQITANDTLLIFDEIQEEPNALKSLKYFYENAPEYNIMAAGSLLGIALHKGTSFPVGKVDILKLYPLSFSEFLLATGNKSLEKLLNDKDYEMIAIFKERIISLLKEYYIVGGMPEAVLAFSKNRDFDEVRRIQDRIIKTYEYDFSKHAPVTEVPRIRLVWNTIPSQLAKENKKFVYGAIRDGARAKEFEIAIMWLYDCSLIHKVSRISTPKVPLKAYEDLKAFKLFLVDIGLLSAMTKLSYKTILDGNDLFVEFKGALTEQFVLQELATLGDIGIYYYTNERNNAEIDFILDVDNKIIPLEVKAETNLKAKSLKSYIDKYNPMIALRSSMASYKEDGRIINLPLYAIENIIKLINEKT